MTDTRTPHAEAHSLELTDLLKVYGDKTVLRSIDLDVRPGEFVSLLGPSGCGKSTALKIIGGFERATSGTVHIGGVDMTRTPAKDRGTGIVFQQYSLFPHITAAQNIEFGLKVRRIGKAERAARVEELLAMVGLEEHGGKYPHQLSGGQQQRVALARALAVAPRILLLDEPLSALDAKVRERLREEIVRIHRDRGTTTIMVTHDQEEALAMADRVAVMHEGEIVQFDTPHEIYANPEPDFVAGFIGVMNRLVPEQVTGTSVRIFGEILSRDAVTIDAGGVLLMRPEDLEIEARTDGRDLVTDLTLRGGVTSATVLLEDLAQSVRVDISTGRATELSTGDRVRVSVARRFVAEDAVEVRIGDAGGRIA
ncbi:ABC transporter ATP-binding protein [Leucobacter sp. CSA1]|uniref:ABC-type quaternary amine transporter n=1 Tax=Leucobacter chromiisoli TaxID=2796471 RepID=A0A934UV79_9MICO|nr:ABC transporter ATP-binding protein [Leucobacter chromiisoli]MBK0418667.1 ABC transporter ATP-binding protein [Leucobacter chromiisoli]